MHFEALGGLTAKEGCAERLKSWFRKNLSDTQSYEGCISVHAIQNQSDPSQMMVIGQWASREKWENYINWRQERGDIATLEELIEGDFELQCFDCFIELRNAT